MTDSRRLCGGLSVKLSDILIYTSKYVKNYRLNDLKSVYQELGGSNSGYSLREQLKVNPAFNKQNGAATSFQDIEQLIATLRTEWKVSNNNENRKKIIVIKFDVRWCQSAI